MVVQRAHDNEEPHGRQPTIPKPSREEATLEAVEPLAAALESIGNTKKAAAVRDHAEKRGDNGYENPRNGNGKTPLAEAVSFGSDNFRKISRVNKRDDDSRERRVCKIIEYPGPNGFLVYGCGSSSAHRVSNFSGMSARNVPAPM